MTQHPPTSAPPPPHPAAQSGPSPTVQASPDDSTGAAPGGYPPQGAPAEPARPAEHARPAEQARPAGSAGQTAPTRTDGTGNDTGPATRGYPASAPAAPAGPPAPGGYANAPGAGQPGPPSGYGQRPSAPPQARPPARPAGNAQPGQSAQPGHRPGGDSAPVKTTAEAETARAALNRLRTEIGKVVVGQDSAVTGLVIALLCRGHVLLEGVPGVAKTLMVRALAASLTLDHKRLQFTPDLMPGDVTGSLVYDARTAQFSFRAGPIFTNLLLADEINRTPPKTQASLLEAMEERQVTIDGEPRPLPDPFLVIATQNPIEYEGTYPLPEAQLDRFLLKLAVPLPSRDDEFRVLNAHHRGFDPRDLRAAGVTPVAGAADLAAGRSAVRSVQAASEVLAYVVDLCRASRQSPSLSLGASPRGATALLATAKAWAWLSGRDYVTPDDVKALARPTLRHRVMVRPEAELEGVTADGVLDSVLAAVPAPR
ncbi:MAG: MoxR-like ATPase [Mycobacteriales bacterium]